MWRFLFLVITIPLLAQLDEENALVPHALANQVVEERPGEEATEVKLGIYLRDLTFIDEGGQAFGAKARVLAQWSDPRLALPYSGIRKYPLSDIWNPLLEIVNAEQKSQESSSFVDSRGNVIFSQTVQGKFFSPQDLKDFPFDTHKLHIRVRSHYGPDEVQLQVDERHTGLAEKYLIPGWKVGKGKAEILHPFSREQNKEQAEMLFSFTVTRDWGFYLWKVIIPISLLVLMAWGVFWIASERIEAQVFLSSAALLTLFAFQFVLLSVLPHATYLTRLDQFMILCFVLVFAALLKAAAFSLMLRRGRTGLIGFTDMFGRIVFPLVFAIGILWIFGDVLEDFGLFSNLQKFLPLQSGM